MTIYYAVIETKTTAGRLANLTQVLAMKKAYSIDATARTATELSGTVYWTNLFTGCYLVSVSDDTDGLSVVFRLLVHADDQSTFADCAALHMREIPAAIATVDGVVDGILEDTAAIPTVSEIGDEVWDLDRVKTVDRLNMTLEEITDTVNGATVSVTRGNTVNLPMPEVTGLDSHYQVLVLKDDRDDVDEKARLVLDSQGLKRLNGQTVSDADADANKFYLVDGVPTIKLEAQYYVKLTEGTYFLGIKDITAAGVVTEKYQGLWTVKPVTSRVVEAPSES